MVTRPASSRASRPKSIRCRRHRNRPLRRPRPPRRSPGNWQVFGDSGASTVTIAPQDGLVKQDGNTQVGQGAILSYFVPESGRPDLKAATDDPIHHLHADNPKLQVTSKTSRNVRVGGSNGLIPMMSGESPFGGAETDVLVTVSRPQGLFYMVLIAPSRSYGQMQDVFQPMRDSLKFNE